MISFSLLTSTPGVLRNQLIARDVIQEVTDPETGQKRLIGVREGLEWIEVPNPIVVTPAQGTPFEPGFVPPVMDPRRCYLVKLVRSAEDNETEGEPRDARPLTDRTKLGKWIKNNSVPETITSADGKSWPSLKVGNNFWLVNSDDFGVWQ